MTTTLQPDAIVVRREAPAAAAIAATLVALLAACGAAITPAAFAARSGVTAPSRAPMADARAAREDRPDTVVVSSGQSIQDAVDANPPGTVFLLGAGTFRGQSVVPRSGDQFIGEPGLTILDGSGTVQYAFYPGRRPYPSDVVIRGLVIQHYAPPLQMGAITAGGHTPADGTVGWIVERCEVRDNATMGIRLGHHMQVLDNKIHHNGRVGIEGTGDSILVAGNEIAFNNYQHKFDMGWGAGGTKFVITRWLIVRNNYVHDNYGPGLWTDESNIYSLYEGNRVVDNAGAGIFHEISYDAVIRNNTVTGNGFARSWYYGAGILIAHSPNVEVYGNTVSGNAQGIAGIQQDRGRWQSPYGPHYLKNLYVHDNIITVGTGRGAAVAGDFMLDSIFSNAWNNRFVHNTYVFGANPTPFEWLGAPCSAAQWRAFGQDRTGMFE